MWTPPLNTPYSTNIRLKLAIFLFIIFFEQICPKMVFTVENGKSVHPIELYIFELVSVWNFTLNWQFWFCGPNLPKNGLPGLKQLPLKHHHQIELIQVSLGAKFQLKLTILILWTKFVQNGYFRSKTKKKHFRVCPCSLLTVLNFSARWPTDKRYFNVCSPSSRRDS